MPSVQGTGGGGWGPRTREHECLECRDFHARLNTLHKRAQFLEQSATYEVPQAGVAQRIGVLGFKVIGAHVALLTTQAAGRRPAAFSFRSLRRYGVFAAPSCPTSMKLKKHAHLPYFLGHFQVHEPKTCQLVESSQPSCKTESCTVCPQMFVGISLSRV